MSNRRFHEHITDAEAIQDSLHSEGLRDAVEVGHMTQDVREGVAGLLSYLGTSPNTQQMGAVERFARTEDDLDRLRQLLVMDTSTAIDCVRGCCSERGAKYLDNRLRFYSELIKGEAMR